MNKLYLLICCLFFYHNSEAQQTLVFKVKQPPPLLVDAGADKVAIKGDPVELGGAVPASGGSGVYTYSWSPAEGLDRTDIANPVATPDSTTTYTLSVSDGAGCDMTAVVTVMVNSVTGVDNFTDKLDIAIYPNPNSGTFTITSTKELDLNPVMLEIHDPLGRLIYKETVEAPGRKLDMLIRLPPHNKGILFIRLSGSRVNVIRKVFVQ